MLMFYFPFVPNFTLDILYGHLHLLLVFHLLSKLIHNFRISEGLSDDDLRETAYELFLASMLFSG